MRLDVSAALVAEGAEVPFAGRLVLSDTEALGEPIAYLCPAELSGVYVSVAGEIRVSGRMTFSALARCGNCLTPAEHTFTVPFDARFVLAADAGDSDAYVYDGAWVDLADMAAETAQLALPMRWVCREGCKGLCPICGANQNETVCSCRVAGGAKHPLSALQQLLTEKEKEV